MGQHHSKTQFRATGCEVLGNHLTLVNLSVLTDIPHPIGPYRALSSPRSFPPAALDLGVGLG